MAWDPKTQEILQLAQELIAIPSVSTEPNPRPEEVRRAGKMLQAYFEWAGLTTVWLEPDHAWTPALFVFFPQTERVHVLWLGHFDVVGPEPDDRQFIPRIEGDYLWGRGAADMKTTVATVAVWMKDRAQAGPPYPPLGLLLVGNEEEGETHPVGTPHALAWYRDTYGDLPAFYIAGERTEETGTRPYGAVCTESRGAVRITLWATGKRTHSGLAPAQSDLTRRLADAMSAVEDLARRYLTLDPATGWYSQVRFPFMVVGQPGLFNVTPDQGVLGIEVRPIPQDPLDAFLRDVETYAQKAGLEILVESPAGGTACDPANPYFQALLQALEEAWNQKPGLCKKFPASSIRYVPKGRAVVWGQSGIGPHSAEERHYIPSILPYYLGLEAYARRLHSLTVQEARKG